MSKYRHEFCEKFGTTKNVRRITTELTDQEDVKRKQAQADRNITKITKQTRKGIKQII